MAFIINVLRINTILITQTEKLTKVLKRKTVFKNSSMKKKIKIKIA